MKSLLTLLLLGLGIHSSLGQGKVSFANDDLHLIYFVPNGCLFPGDQPGQPIPSPTASGFTLVADLLAGTSSTTLTKVKTTVLGATPGRLTASSVTLTGIPGGSTAYFQVQVYDSRYSSLSSAQINSAYWGLSPIFTCVPGASLAYNNLASHSPPSNSTWPDGTYDMDFYSPGDRGAIVISSCIATGPYGDVHPPSQSVLVGQNATFTANFLGDSPLRYQWRFYGTNIPGATGSSYTRTNAQYSHAGPYSVYVTNFISSMLSSNATLTVASTSFPLNAFSAGGGAISLNPPGGIYPSNGIVTLTAASNSGWRFLKWLGDASGTNPNVQLTMNRAKCVQALFGTTLGTSVTGNGSVQVNPVSDYYPYGSIVRLTAVPAADSYFAAWGNGAAGSSNTLYFTVTNANPVISTTFSTLGVNQAALSVKPIGNGLVNINPYANVYTVGTAVTLSAIPEAGQTFLGWSGDAAGTQNPLLITVNSNRNIAAQFTSRPMLSVGSCVEGLSDQGFRFTLTGDFGASFQIQSAPDLVTWGGIGTITNTYGVSQFTDPAATSGSNRFYRALALP
jgi:hypothetical protein